MKDLHSRREFRPVRHLGGKLGVGTLLLALAAGCGGEPFAFVPVTGKIAYTDGTLIPAEELMVRFVPVDPVRQGADVAPPVTGVVNQQDGTFAGVRVVPGHYRVMVIALKNHVPSTEVPKKYLSATESPLSIEVTRQMRDFPQLQVEKPK